MALLYNENRLTLRQCRSALRPADGAITEAVLYFSHPYIGDVQLLSVVESFQKLHRGLNSRFRWCVCVDMVSAGKLSLRVH